MFEFAPSFASFEESADGEPGKGLNAADGETDRQAGPRRSGSILSFRQRGASDDAETRDFANAGEGAQASGMPVEEPPEPVAYPMHKTRVEGAAYSIYQLSEDPMRDAPAPARPSRSISTKTEVDIATFLEAVSAAFPRPRDPLMPRVLRARPKKAARPFLYVAEELSVPNVTPAGRVSTPRGLTLHQKDLVEIAGPIVTVSKPMPYDPILKGDGTWAGKASKAAEIKAGASASGDHGQVLEGVELRVARRKAEINPVRRVEEHERALIDARIEPLEPVAKPRYPLPTEVPGPAEPRLSPSQRAHLRRPAVVRDCHGRLTPVTYSLNPQGRGQD